MFTVIYLRIIKNHKISGYQTIALAPYTWLYWTYVKPLYPICPSSLIIDYWAMHSIRYRPYTFIYQRVRFERFVITLGVLRHSFYTRRNFRLELKESDLHYRFRKPLYGHYRNLNYSFIIPCILRMLTTIAHLGQGKV